HPCSGVCETRRAVWFQTRPVQIQLFEDGDHPLHGQPPLARPADDIEIFPTGMRPVENQLEQQVSFHQQIFDQTEIARIELFPDSTPFEMLEALAPAITRPESLIPVVDRGLTE